MQRNITFFENEDITATIYEYNNSSEQQYVLDITGKGHIRPHRYFLISQTDGGARVWRIRNLYRFICDLQERGSTAHFDSLPVGQQLGVFKSLIAGNLAAEGSSSDSQLEESMPYDKCFHPLGETDKARLLAIASGLKLT